MLTQGPLVRINRSTFELEPWLAERWESSADGLTHTLHLRQGLTWSDGTPLTSADVLFSLRAVYDPTVREGISATALLRQADAALYDAKARGRDRIVVAQGTPPPSSSSGSAPVLDKLVRRRTDPRGVPIKTPAKGTKGA